MASVTIDRPAAARSQRLMAATRAVHDGLDDRIISADPFRDRIRYAGLLRMQYLFHRDIDPLYAMPLPLAATVDLSARRRVALVAQDLRDLGVALPDDPAPAFADALPDPVTAIGWLWVAEGSNLGAAALLKRAAALGLHGAFGARHLAGHPDGRAAHWRAFTAAVNALDLEDGEDARLREGACAAFARVRTLADDSLA